MRVGLSENGVDHIRHPCGAVCTLTHCMFGFYRPEGKIKQLEERISMLIEQSVLASCTSYFKKALDHAKEAQHKEKSLLKLREQAGVAESHDWDISFSVRSL